MPTGRCELQDEHPSDPRSLPRQQELPVMAPPLVRCARRPSFVQAAYRFLPGLFDMCNGHKHPAGCDCGFGPPYNNFLSYGSATEWPLAVIDEPWLVRRSLEDLSWDEAAVKKFVADYTRLVAQDLPRGRLAGKIKELLGRREMRVEKRWNETLKVPLYRFGPPAIPGAKVTYSEALRFQREVTWSLKVFGVGTGHTREMAVTADWTFVADRGRCMQVYVPVPMTAEQVAVYEDGRLVGRGVRAEVRPPRTKKDLAITRRGCDTLRPNDCASLVDDESLELVEVHLEGERSGSLHRHERRWKWDSTTDVSVHLKKVVEVGPRVRVKRHRELRLSFALPGGHDYLGHLCRGRLWWESPIRHSAT